jgi:hypothetical protein
MTTTYSGNGNKRSIVQPVGFISTLTQFLEKNPWPISITEYGYPNKINKACSMGLMPNRSGSAAGY